MSLAAPGNFAAKDLPKLRGEMRREWIEQEQERAQAQRQVFSAVVRAFTKIIIWEIAVLKESVSISPVTFLIVACRIFSCGFVRLDVSTAPESIHSPA